ncbi:hypothetical protein FRC01_012741 [Tulasnella sp. 417]|nr:hypothetical protein FRC01_012741 [Tulasnella sp. 417]
MESPSAITRAQSLSGDPSNYPSSIEDIPGPAYRSRTKQLKESMVVSFGISKKVLVDDFKQWPELAAEIENFDFKRYLGMVAWSSVFDPNGRWFGPQPPPEAPPENAHLYLIGPEPPQPEYFPNFIKEMYPSKASSMCRAISTAPQRKATAEEARPPYQIEGPPLRFRNLETAYLYNSNIFNVRAKSVTPYKAAEGAVEGWAIRYDGKSSKRDKYFKEAEDTLYWLRAEYKMEHNIEEPLPGYTLEGGKMLWYGIEARLRLAAYEAPVEVSLDIDTEEDIGDPCDFKKEITAVRRPVVKPCIAVCIEDVH